jgi:hypothetical protein
LRHVAGKTTTEIYSAMGINKDLDPFGVKIRESRDSEDNPLSTAIIVGLDVTGSMHMVLDTMAKECLNTLITEIYNRKPVHDPHIMIMGIGDVEIDRAPLQVTQFEADIRIAKQLKDIYLEGGGGGNNYESYTLPWYFAVKHTEIDCLLKRGKKGYLFTIGDENPTPLLRGSHIERFLGDKNDQNFTASELLAQVSQKYNVYHLMVEEGSYFKGAGDSVVKEWVKLLGQRAIRLSDHRKLSEVIVAAISINEGLDKEAIIESWKGDTAKVVKYAVKDLVFEKPTESVVRF